jgi:isopenicillin N synthase-like dioxygenase
MGKSRSGATLHGCTRSEGELPDHATADGGPLSDRGAITQVPRQDAGFRGAELVAGYAGTLLSGGKHRFDRDFFTRAQDPADDTYQCTLRLLHYYAIAPEVLEKMEVVRGGAHTDFNCLTLLYQRAGQPGLQVCPGKAYDAPRWTPVDPREDLITCNIGDMLMRWSDDQLLSTLHRVRKPLAGEYLGPRYSMAFFCQANTDALITSRSERYPAITAGDYLAERMRANYHHTR